MTAVRVLHLINGQYFGGSARVLLNYLTASNRRADVAVGVVFKGELLERCAQLGVPATQISMRSRYDIAATQRIVQLVRRFNADMIHTHQVRTTLLGRLAGRVQGVPVVTHVHSPAARESTRRLNNIITSSVDRRMAPWSARFIAVSDSLATELRRTGIRSSRIRVVHNGIHARLEANRRDPRDIRAELGIHEDEFVVGMVANYRPRKGAEVLIDAIGGLAHEGLNVKLVFIGEPFREPGRDYGEELRLRAGRLGITKRTLFTGFRPDAEQLLDAFDVFVLPSLFGEGLPMVLLEAMAARLPVISTPVEGIPEVIDNGRNGWLVEPGDSLQLAQAIRKLERDRRLRGRLGDAAHRTVMDAFTVEHMSAGIERVYAELG